MPPADTVILQFPAATAVTVPFSTVATEISLLLQVISASAASLGVITAYKFAVLPTVNESDSLSNSIFSIAISDGSISIVISASKTVSFDAKLGL